MDLKGVGCEDVDWIHLARDRIQGFYRFEPLKKHRAGKQFFQLVADVKVTCRLQTLDIDFFCASL
jgi:hypothetical protein